MNAHDDDNNDNGFPANSDSNSNSNSNNNNLFGCCLKESSKYKNVIMIGSSGGGTATFGHAMDPIAWFRMVNAALQNSTSRSRRSSSDVKFQLSRAFWITLQNKTIGMDQVQDASTEPAILYEFTNTSSTIIYQEHYGSLQQVNNKANVLQRGLQLRKPPSNAENDNHNIVWGIISVSSHATIFKDLLQQCNKYKIPLTGTGGTSIGQIANQYPQIPIIGNTGGSVATCTNTRIVSYVTAFMDYYNTQQNDNDNNKSSSTTSNESTTNTISTPSLRSTLNACLPAFWTMMIYKTAIQQFKAIEMFQNVLTTFIDDNNGNDIHSPLPLCCGILTSLQQNKNNNNSNNNKDTNSVINSNALFATILVIYLTPCQKESSIIGSMAIAVLIQYLEPILLFFLIRYCKLPATMTNLLTTGILTWGLIVLLNVTPLIQTIQSIANNYNGTILPMLFTPISSLSLFNSLEILRRITLGILGMTMCYGSKVGWYHLIFLPLILLEMEAPNNDNDNGASLLGAVDELTLVLVSFGICLAKFLLSSTEQQGQIIIVFRGLLINFTCGDFVEVVYPIMEESIIINVCGYIASAISVSMLTTKCSSFAYLPWVASIWVSHDKILFIQASLVAIGIPFIGTIVDHLFYSKQRQKLKEEEKDKEQ